MKIITFDVTNTLIRVALSVGQQYNQILARSKFGVCLDKELADSTFRRLFRRQNERLPGYGFRRGMSSREWWSGVSKEVLRENWRVRGKPAMSEREMDAAANLLFDEFCLGSYWHKYEGCDKVLDELRKAGYQLGIISNFDERIYRILENMNLHGYFDFVQIPSSCEGFAKPSPEIFQATRALANRKYGPPLLDHQFLHVGDNVELDYRAARASGFQALLLCHNADDLAAVKEDDVILRNGDYALDLVQLKDKVLDKF